MELTENRHSNLKYQLRKLWNGLRTISHYIWRCQFKVESYLKLAIGTVEMSIGGFAVMMQMVWLPVVLAQMETGNWTYVPPGQTIDLMEVLFGIWPFFSLILSLTLFLAVMVHGIIMFFKAFNISDSYGLRIENEAFDEADDKESWEPLLPWLRVRKRKQEK